MVNDWKGNDFDESKRKHKASKYTMGASDNNPIQQKKIRNQYGLRFLFCSSVLHQKWVTKKFVILQIFVLFLANTEKSNKMNENFWILIQIDTFFLRTHTNTLCCLCILLTNWIFLIFFCSSSWLIASFTHFTFLVHFILLPFVHSFIHSNMLPKIISQIWLSRHKKKFGHMFRQITSIQQ